MAHHAGRVIWFNNAKGFGFLSRDGASDVFCHFSSIVTTGYKTLKEQDPVEFDVEIGASGKPQAANVLKIENVASPA